MKKLSVLLIFCISVFTNLLAQNFEGIIVMDMVAQGMNITQEYKVKGEKAVIELKMGGIPVQKMYVDGEKKEVYMLMEKEQKIAMKLKTDNPNKTEDKNKPKVTVTKETKEILGYKCTKIIKEDEKGTSTAWVTKDLNIDFNKLMPSSKKNKDNADISKYGFPLEMEAKDEKGATVSMKVTKVEKTTVDNAVFPNLSEYQVQDMPSMGR